MTALWVLHDVLILILGAGGSLAGAWLAFYMMQRSSTPRARQ